MKTALFLFAAFTVGLLSGSVHAAANDDACRELLEARGFLVTLLDAPDKTAQDDLTGRVHDASGRFDRSLAALQNGPDAARIAEAAKVWEAFKTTREAQIIPAVYAGRRDEAKGLATGVQAERMKAMKAALGCGGGAAK